MHRLAEISSIWIGVAPPAKGRGGEAGYVQIKDLRQDGVPSLRGPTPSANRAVSIQNGDLLIPSRGHELTAVPATLAMVGAYAALDVYLVRPNIELVAPGYLLVVLNSDKGLAQIRGAITGGALPRIPRQALDELEIPLPRRPVQERIAAVGALARRSETLHRQRLDAERRLNDALLARAIDIIL